MAKCTFCNKETSLVYICPLCDNRFCSQHRKPENHNCQAITHVQTQNTFRNLGNENNQQVPINENLKPILNDSEDLNSIEIVKAQTHAVLTSILGSQKKLEDFDEEEQIRYNKIYEYFLGAWKQNMKLKQANETIAEEVTTLKAELDKKNIEYEKLLEEFESISSKDE